MTKRSVKLMADYDCSPLWYAGAEFGNIDPDELPLSDATKIALWAWAETFNASLNRSDPARSGFDTPELAGAFHEEGARLQRVVQEELGTQWDVSYQPVSLSLSSPDAAQRSD